MHPLIVLGIAVGIAAVIFFVIRPLATRSERRQNTATKSGRSSSADAAKTSGNGPK